MSFGIANTWESCDAQSTSATTRSGCERGRTGLPLRQWPYGKKAIHHHSRKLAPGLGQATRDATRGRGRTAMSPNYKKGGGDVACCAVTSPERSGKGRDAGEAGAPLSGWPAPATCRRKKTRETKRKAGGDLVGHYYVVSRCPIDTQASQARQLRPSRGENDRE